MDSLQRAVVSLLIYGDDLVPSEITELLGQEPKLGVSKGEVFLDGRGKHVQARTGMWQFGGGWESPPNLDKQITVLLDSLNADVQTWQNLTERFHCYVGVGGYLNDWTGGATLQPTTLKLLVERALAIDFDLYAPAASD